jgi:hypothetical protein
MLPIPPSTEEPGVGAHHEDLAVREVDELEDAVDHRVPERDEANHRPLPQPVESTPESERYAPTRTVSVLGLQPPAAAAIVKAARAAVPRKNKRAEHPPLLRSYH